MTLRRLSPPFGVALLAALAMAACGGPQGVAPGAGVTATPAPIVVRDARVAADGRLVPRRWAALSSSAGGRVIEIAAVEGDPVSAGDLLLRVDDAPQRAALAEAEAALEGARAQAAQLRAGATAEERAGAEAAVAAATAASQAAEGALATARAAGFCQQIRRAGVE